MSIKKYVTKSKADRKKIKEKRQMQFSLLVSDDARIDF